MAKPKKGAKHARPGTVRISGGQWRSRRIAVPAADVRPSGDRVRETLFNWLAPYVDGASCLDMFAGSGVLAFEALSRGAVRATLVDINVSTIGLLQQTCAAFDHPEAEIIHQDVFDWLRSTPRREFDIVFLDPPFGQDLLTPALEYLVDGWLSRGAKIYLESDEFLPELPLPASLRWTKHARLGNVSIAVASN